MSLDTPMSTGADEDRESRASFLRAIRDVGNAWKRFWFEPQDPIVLSSLRLLVGGMAFYNLLIWGLGLQAFFGPDGWQAEPLIREIQRDQWAFSFWWWVSSDWLTTVHVLCLIVTAMFFLGLGTRVTAILSFLVTISYAHRAPLANYGLDQILAFLTFYLAMGPCGARLSLDAWIRRWLARRRNLPQPTVSSMASARLPMRLIQCQLCVIYFWAGISKLQGATWWAGEAIWRVAANYEYQQVSLTWLAYVPWFYQLATLGTWLWEISFSFLVWRRYLRWPILAVGVTIHVGIGMFLGMWTFGLIMIFAYVAFVPPAWVYAILWWLPRGRGSLNEPNIRPEERTTPQASASPTVEPSLANQNLVAYLDSSARRQSQMVARLSKIGFRCVTIDAWPETISICAAVAPRVLLFNARYLQASELQHWLQLLDETAGAAAPKLIGLLEPREGLRLPDLVVSDNLQWVELPVELEELRSVLSGMEFQNDSDQTSHTDEQIEARG